MCVTSVTHCVYVYAQGWVGGCSVCPIPHVHMQLRPHTSCIKSLPLFCLNNTTPLPCRSTWIVVHRRPRPVGGDLPEPAGDGGLHDGGGAFLAAHRGPLEEVVHLAQAHKVLRPGPGPAAVAGHAELEVQVGGPLLDEVTHGCLEEHEDRHARVGTRDRLLVDEVVQVGRDEAGLKRPAELVQGELDAVRLSRDEEEGVSVHLEGGSIPIDGESLVIAPDAPHQETVEEAAGEVVTELKVQGLGVVAGDAEDARGGHILHQRGDDDGARGKLGSPPLSAAPPRFSVHPDPREQRGERVRVHPHAVEEVHLVHDGQ